MTVGEKIQFYRKKIGLSQEELGQKMLVSRQTVSLWEMDKTLPTVDNLLRLKEIFNVSVDNILNKSYIADESKDIPRELYIFSYSTEDLKTVFKNDMLPIIKRAVISAFLFVFSFISISQTEGADTISGLIIGCFLVNSISNVKGFFSVKKQFKADESRLLQNTYSYEIYDQYFISKISRNEEVIRTQKIYFYEIENIESFETYMVIRVAGMKYIIKKDCLRADSVFFYLFKQRTVKIEAKSPEKYLKIASNILFVFSLATIFCALFFVGKLSVINHAMTDNMWMFFVFVPVPVASVIFGFYLKKKGYKYKKNVITGFIMAALLCCYGSFTFIFSDIYSHDDDPILMAEEILDIDIPDHSQINTQDWTIGTQSMPRGYVYFTSDIYFEDSSVTEFEKSLQNNPKWMSEIPSDMVGITSYFCELQPSDFYIIYNTDTKEFNKLPSESGIYRLINVMYNSGNNTMKLVEYQIEYAK